MRANSPSAFFTSLTLHGVVAALIIFFTYYASHHVSEAPVIFELVAGPPTAPDELVAPALGNTTHPVKLDVPKTEVAPEPPVAETVKTVETPPVKEEVVPPPPKPEAKPVPAKKPAPPPTVSKQMVQEMKQSQRTSYKDYLKKHPTPKTPPKTVAKATGKAVPRIDTQGIAEGVRGGSTANTRGGGGGKALTREEQSQLNTYIALLLNRLKDAHEPPQGASDTFEAKVTFDITATGMLLNPRITKSSGDREFDESVLEAFRKVRSIGPPPTGKSDTWTVTFRMRDE